MELILLAVAAVLVVFMFFSSRRRKKEAATLETKMVPGAEIMTSFGLFGTIVSIDEETHTAIIEVAPGTEVKVYRQTLARVIEPVVEDEEAVEDAADETPAVEAEPKDAAETAAADADVKRKDAE